MLYNIKTGHNGIRKCANDEIVIIVSSLRALQKKQVPFLFTDRHALLRAAQFYSDLENLDQIDWPILQNRDFKRDPDDMEKVERYQAEALVFRQVPIDALLGIVCYKETVASNLEARIDERGLDLRVVTKRNWYF